MAEAYCPKCDLIVNYEVLPRVRELDLYKCENCGSVTKRENLIDNSLEMAIIRYLESNQLNKKPES